MLPIIVLVNTSCNIYKPLQLIKQDVNGCNILLSEEAFSVSNVVFYQTKSDMQIK